MSGWHHRLDGREFESTLGVGDGQGGARLLCPWDSSRILEWVAISYSRGSSQTRDQTYISCIAGRFLLLLHLGSPVV